MFPFLGVPESKQENVKVVSLVKLIITKTCLFKYTDFTTNYDNVQIKKFDLFHISAQNIDCVRTF